MALTNKKMELYWFSGTGNTLLVSKLLSGNLNRLGFEVNMISLPSPVPENIPAGTILAIAAPVYCFTLPPFVDEWISKLPDSADKTPVVLISTLAGMSGLVKGPYYHIFKRKGYLPYAVKEFIMPPNIIHQTDKEPKIDRIIRKTEKKVADFANQIASGKAKWPCRPVFLNSIHRFTVRFFKYGGAWSGSRFYVDESKCTKCGLCIKMCPVKNIEALPGGFPVWAKKCQQCLRCIYYCPSDAVKNRIHDFLYRPRYKCPGITPSELTRKA